MSYKAFVGFKHSTTATGVEQRAPLPYGAAIKGLPIICSAPLDMSPGRPNGRVRFVPFNDSVLLRPTYE